MVHTHSDDALKSWTLPQPPSAPPRLHPRRPLSLARLPRPFPCPRIGAPSLQGWLRLRPQLFLPAHGLQLHPRMSRGPTRTLNSWRPLQKTTRRPGRRIVRFPRLSTEAAFLHDRCRRPLRDQHHARVNLPRRCIGADLANPLRRNWPRSGPRRLHPRYGRRHQPRRRFELVHPPQPRRTPSARRGLASVLFKGTRRPPINRSRHKVVHQPVQARLAAQVLGPRTRLALSGPAANPQLTPMLKRHKPVLGLLLFRAANVACNRLAYHCCPPSRTGFSHPPACPHFPLVPFHSICIRHRKII